MLLLVMILGIVVEKIPSSSIPHQINPLMAPTPITEDVVVAIVREMVRLNTPLILDLFAKSVAKMARWPYSVIVASIMSTVALPLIWQHI